jgi:Fe-S-cluster containining protein
LHSEDCFLRLNTLARRNCEHLESNRFIHYLVRSSIVKSDFESSYSILRVPAQYLGPHDTIRSLRAKDTDDDAMPSSSSHLEDAYANICIFSSSCKTTMTMLKIRRAYHRQPISRLVPTTTLIYLVVIFLLEQEASVAEAFHTSSSNSLRTLQKSNFGILRRSSFLSTNLFAGDDDDNNSEYNDKIALTRFLQKARDRALDAFAAQEAPSWMIDDSAGSSESDTLPFSCTGCGKCCQTTGSVYMSPSEYNKAADYLNVTADAFIGQYASHTLVAVPAKPAVAVVSGSVSDTATATTEAIVAAAAEPWICIKDQHTSEPSDDADDIVSGPACIFLDRTTNQCQIYPVRPVQCRTYPFWPTVTASVESWNAECRRLEIAASDSDSDSDSDDSSSLPRWTPDLGGCEGMRLVSEKPSAAAAASIGNDDFIATGAVTTTSTATKNEHDPQPLLESVPRQTALELLHEYVVEERRFPHGAKEVPIAQEVPVE